MKRPHPHSLKTIVNLAAATLCLMAAPVLAAQPIKVEGGLIEGQISSGVESFKGIPYAQPPVGTLRWRAPQPVKPWSGLRTAKHFGSDCMQTIFPGDAAPLRTTPAEDCLYLNIWRPEGVAANARLPVVIWIHGGGLVNGGASPAVYDGSAFAQEGTIFVSLNYRLGRFGFFGFPALSAADSDKGYLGNYGYMDQIAAVTWVQKNIRAFGGDPANITIFGESAGGRSVHMFLTSPETKGLFQRAVILSGGGRGDLIGPRKLKTGTEATPSAETIGVNFAQSHGLTTHDARALAALRALSAEAVTSGLNMATMGPAAHTYPGPMHDGRIVTASPQVSYLSDRYHKVPVMVGATSADIGFSFAKTKDDAFKSFGPAAEAAKAAYDPDGTADIGVINALIGRDRMMVEPARFVAATLSYKGQNAYQYRFSYVAKSVRAEWPGAWHATDVPYFMGTVEAAYGDKATDEDRAMARTAHSYLVNFARSGNPNGASLTNWPAYDPAKDILLDFANDGAVAKPDPLKARLDATEAAAPKQAD